MDVQIAISFVYSNQKYTITWKRKMIQTLIGIFCQFMTMVISQKPWKSLL